MNEVKNQTKPHCCDNKFATGVAFATSLIGGAVQGGLWATSGVCTGEAEFVGCPNFLLVKNAAPWIILLAVFLNIVSARLDSQRIKLWLCVFIFASMAICLGVFGHFRLMLDSIFFGMIITSALVGSGVGLLLKGRTR